MRYFILDKILNSSVTCYCLYKPIWQNTCRFIYCPRRLEKLTEDILDVSRIEGKNLQLSKSNFDLNQTIQQVIEDYQKEALEKGLKIIFE
jgi:hypothetical protein